MLATYEQDVVKWSEEQAQLLLNRDFEHLDIAHLAEEILDVGKSEIRELKSRMAVLLMHLIKCEVQPERYGRSWENTIKVQREMIELLIAETPSLKSKMTTDFWRYVWKDALVKFNKETELGIASLPSECPWTFEVILLKDNYPTLPPKG